MANVEPRTAMFAERVALPTSRYRASPSPPGTQGPRPILVERTIREERVRHATGREHPVEETRYAFVSPESDGSDIDARGQDSHSHSPPPVRVRRRSRSYSGSPSAQVIYSITQHVIDWENYEDFSFDCEKSDALKNGDSLSFDTASAEPDTSRADANRFTDDSRVKGVLYSRYTGDAETGGSHTAQLTEVHNGSGELFKWLYVEQIAR